MIVYKKGDKTVYSYLQVHLRHMATKRPCQVTNINTRGKSFDLCLILTQPSLFYESATPPLGSGTAELYVILFHFQLQVQFAKQWYTYMYRYPVFTSHSKPVRAHL